jgi:hypothetical protein
MHRWRLVVVPAVFAVLAANYQRTVSRSRQKSWAASGAGIDKTARPPAVLPLFAAVFVTAAGDAADGTTIASDSGEAWCDKH